MSKISPKEVEKILESEGEIIDSVNFPKDNNAHEEFSIASCARGRGITYKGEELKEGMSYSSSMLDINELMAKKIVGLGDKIDLRDFPEVDTLQVAWQSQLDMLDDASKAQIKSIHLSNNTPVGWNRDFEYDNYFPMDKTLDLSDYANVTQLQTHFYLNNDLNDIILPEGVEEIFCKHSKMASLYALDDVPTFLYLSETADDIDEFAEGMKRYNDYQVLKHYSYKKEKDGTYTLCHDGEPVARGFDEEKELRWNCQCGYNDIFSDEIMRDSDVLSIKGDISLRVTKDGKHYKCEESEDMGVNLCKDVFVNPMDENDKIVTLFSTDWYSEDMRAAFDRDVCVSIRTGRHDVGRGYTPRYISLYAKHGDDFLVVSNRDRSVVTPKLYSDFLDKAKDEGVDISKTQMRAIESKILFHMGLNEGFNEYYLSDLENLNPYVQKFFSRGKKLIEMRKKVARKESDEEKPNHQIARRRFTSGVSLHEDDALKMAKAIAKDRSK